MFYKYPRRTDSATQEVNTNIPSYSEHISSIMKRQLNEHSSRKAWKAFVRTKEQKDYSIVDN